MTIEDFVEKTLKFECDRNRRTKFILKDQMGSVLKIVDIPSRYIIDKRFDVIKRALEILTEGHILKVCNIEMEEVDE